MCVNVEYFASRRRLATRRIRQIPERGIFPFLSSFTRDDYRRVRGRPRDQVETRRRLKRAAGTAARLAIYRDRCYPTRARIRCF